MVDLVTQLPGDNVPALFDALGNLVADAPQDDARVIAIAQDHRVQIALPPIIEVFAVVLRILAFFPAVKGLVQHQHAQPVAGIQKNGGGGIVAGADRVVAIRFHELNSAFFGAVNRRRAERAVVMMYAAAAQLH